jgi:methyl-accepting chemotaxis protein
MEQSIETSPTDIAAQIDGVIKNTEIIFDGIAGIFPKLSSELEKGRNTSELQVESLKTKTATFRNTASASSLLAKTKAVLREASDSFNTLHLRDDQLLESLRKEIEVVRELDYRISDIRESSESMELISLNAMTVAIKAGKAGGAFSFITEELKRISARSIVYTEELTAEGKEIDEAFSNFLSAMEKVEEVQTKLLQDFGSFVDTGFQKAGNATDGAIDFLKDIIEESKTIWDPLTTIMQQVQHQDIIRQSLDHVVLALRELKIEEEPIGQETVEELLDELVFLRTIPRLCSDLINDVSEQIRQSYNLFKGETERIGGVMSSIEQKVRDYRHGASLSSYFNEAEASIVKIRKSVTSSLDMKVEITSRSENLMQKVEALQQSFIDFSELVGQFQNVNVASKIEVAKQQALESMEATVEEMSNLTHFIDSTVENALQSIHKFFKRTQESLLFYREMYKSEASFADNFQHDMAFIAEDANSTVHGIEAVIENFSAFGSGFIQTYQETEELLEKLSECRQELAQSTNLLGEIEELFDKQFQKELARNGLTDWNIRSERFQNIIKRFTILEHKKVAGKIGGFEVEEGSAGGEITFF